MPSAHCLPREPDRPGCDRPLPRALETTMSVLHLLSGRLSFLVPPLVGAIGLFGGAALAQPGGGDTSIRPFKFHASDEALADLRRRIGATRWPSRELVADASQGVQLATMR